MPIARKQLGWYAKDRPANVAFRQVVNRAEDAETQLRLTREYFDALDAGVSLAAGNSRWERLPTAQERR